MATKKTKAPKKAAKKVAKKVTKKASPKPPPPRSPYFDAEAEREAQEAYKRLELIRASATYAGAVRFLKPMRESVRLSAMAAVRARAQAERGKARLLTLSPRLFPTLRGLAKKAIEAAVRAEQSAEDASRALDNAYRRVEWFARREGYDLMVRLFDAARARPYSDWTDSGDGPGRGEIMASYGDQASPPLDDPEGDLFRLGDVVQSVPKKFPPLRTQEPDGGLQGRVRFEVQIDTYENLSPEARKYIDSILKGLQVFYGIGYRENPKYQKREQTLKDGRFVPKWYDVRNAGAATLWAMGRIESLRDNNISVLGVVCQVLVGRFRTRKLSAKTREKFEAFERAGLTFGGGPRP